MERTHCELEHVRNNRKFRKINKLCYGIHKSMVEWYLKRCAMCSSHRKNKTWASFDWAPFEPVTASQVLKGLRLDLVDFRSRQDEDMRWICHLK